MFLLGIGKRSLPTWAIGFTNDLIDYMYSILSTYEYSNYSNGF